MEKKIAIIGGDLRIGLLAELLAKENWQVQTYGLENYEAKEQIEKIADLSELCKQTKLVFSAVPLSKDGRKINAPFAQKDIPLKKVLEEMREGTFLAGGIKAEWKKGYETKIQFVDLLEDERLTIQNAISTAEGAIQKMLEKTVSTIYGSKILILGFGRIGKLLASRLEKFGAEIWCEARKQEDLTWIEAYGYHSVALSKLNQIDLSSFSIVANTIPHIVFKCEEIAKLNPDCYVIDLASSPGGVDQEEIGKRGITFDWALALPGKVAPKTSAEFLKQAFERFQMQ